MFLTRHRAEQGIRWALNGFFLPESIDLRVLLQLPRQLLIMLLPSLPRGEPATAPPLAPLEATHEVWASGVTYMRSREARVTESRIPDIYERVYEAERPELFFKTVGWRVQGDGAPVRVRPDSTWCVPEPELVLVINRHLEIVGYCAGNDVSARDIEGENPLYLPQAKIFDGACALGPGIVLVDDPAILVDLPVQMTIVRDSQVVYAGETRTSRMKRRMDELVSFLGRYVTFPEGVFLMTGTGIVPPDDFSLRPGDEVHITVGELKLVNPVAKPLGER